MAAQFRPLEQSFQTFILQLYRQWYGLPRKSTLAWLADERFDLAEALRGEEPLEALNAFVSQATLRPGVAEAVEDELAAVQTSLHNHFLAQLSPEGIDTLASLLTVQEPVSYAFSQWVYLSSRAANTVAQVRKRLDDDVLARLPQPTLDAIAAIFETLDAELAGNGAEDGGFLSERAGQRRQAMRQALTALEQNPAVLRTAWRELLAGKAEEEPRVLGLEGAMGVPALVPVGAEKSAAEAAATEQETRFHTDVNFPQRVKPGDETPLTVRLTLEKPETSRITKIVGVQFPDSEKPELIEVVVDAPGFAERFDLWHRTMVVYSDRDSEPVTFLLTADEGPRDRSQARSIRVSFNFNGKYIGGGAFTVEVDRHAPAASRSVTLDEESADVDLRLVNRPRPADLEIRVMHDTVNSELHFMLHSTKSEVGYHWRRMGSVKLLNGAPHAYFQRALEQLNEWSGLLPEELYEHEVDEFTRKMGNLGEELFERLFSPELRDAYWRDIECKRKDGTIRSVLFTSDEPWIPWELVKPYRYDAATDEEEVGPYLADAFQVSRWLTGYGPYEQVTIDAAGIVVPDSGLDFADMEGDYLTGLRSHGVAVSGPLRTKSDVLDAVEDGSLRLLHIASHAGFDQENPDASPIELEDADLLPEDLDRRVIRQWRTSRPLIFLNACEGGRIEYKLTGLGGWANKFIREVRATAFLGTLWKVNDKLAAEFARVFYDELLAGHSLGLACQTARLHIKELAPANPTWLAYTLYGDPNTRVDWGEIGDR